jgi:hypothetical protein
MDNKDILASHHEISASSLQGSSNSQIPDQYGSVGPTTENDTADVLLEVGIAGGEKGATNDGLKLAPDGIVRSSCL